MGLNSLKEDIQECYDELQRRLDRKKTKDDQSEVTVLMELQDKIKRDIEALNQLIDLAADPEVRWAEKAQEYQAQVDRAHCRIKLLEEKVRSLEATLKQERESHAAKIKQLKDWYGRKIKDHELGRHYVGQQLGKRPSTHHRNQRPSIKLGDHLTPDQKMKLLKMIDSRARTDLTARGVAPRISPVCQGKSKEQSL